MLELCGNDAHCQNVVVHCGGPGTDDTCANFRKSDSPWGDLGARSSALEDGWLYQYNILGIAQRGISSDKLYGPNYPRDKGEFANLAVPIDTTNNPIIDESCNGVPDPDFDFSELTAMTSIKEITTCQCALPEPGSGIEPDHNSYVNPTAPTSVSKFFEYYASVLRNCHASPYWQIPVPGPDGASLTRNALDYIGTAQLARDMNRLREAIGAETLGCNGVSYGTAVCSSFAAAFPDKVGRWAVNGNVDVSGLADSYFESVAIAQTQQNGKLLKMCRTGYGPGTTCLGTLTESPGEQFTRIMNLISDNPKKFSAPMKGTSERFSLTPAMYYNGALSITTQNKNIWFNVIDMMVSVEKFVQAVYDANETTAEAMVIDELNSKCKRGQWEHGWCKLDVYKKPGFGAHHAIRAADYSNRFSRVAAEQLTNSLLTRYTPSAVAYALSKAGKNLIFPTEPTPNVYGYRSTVGGYVIGALYDDATPFVNARRMRESMPKTSLITWQGIGHGVGDASTYDPEGVAACNRLTALYWKDGTQPPDGYVCRNSARIQKDEEDARSAHKATLVKATKSK